MIMITSISNLRNVDDSYTKYAIVRSLKNKINGVEQVSVLSPSWNLFSKYRNLVDKNDWNEKSFQRVYVPQFLSEMHSAEAVKALNNLYKLDKTGRNICLVCFCKDETLCHRSIIAGLLQGVDCNVVGVKADYSSYYAQYKNA